MPQPYLRQVILNAMRMAATFGAGFTTLWMFGRHGAPVQAEYLLLLGLRWVLSIPVLGLDSVSVPAVAAGRGAAARRVALWISTAFVTIAALGGVTGLGNGLLLAGTLCAAAQVLSAEPLARLLLQGRVGVHAALLATRRFVDLAAVLAALHLFDTDVFPTFLAILSALMVAHAFACHWLTRVPSDHAGRAGFDLPCVTVAAMIVAGAQVMALRAPVLVLGLALPPAFAIPASLAFVLGGYLRQAITVGIVGLDGMAARLGAEGQAQLARQALLTVATLSLAALVFVIAWSSWLISQLLPAEVPPPPGFGVLLTVVLSGVMLRGLSDTWIKLASGQGRQADLLWPVAGHAVASAALMLAASLLLSATDLALAIGLIFGLGQVALLLLLVPIARERRDLSAPSSPTG